MNVWMVIQGPGAKRFLETLAADEAIHVFPALQRKGVETVLNHPETCAEMDALVIHGSALVNSTWVDRSLIDRLKVLAWKRKIHIILFFTNKRTESSLRRYAAGFHFVAHPATPQDLYEQVRSLVPVT